MIKSKISPACKRIRLAGSIRRKKSIVKDIELVCELKSTSQGKLNKILNNLVLKNNIKIIKDGDRYKQFVLLNIKQEELIKVDLFIVKAPAQWGIIYLIRTGSAEFSKRFVTEIKPNFRVKNGHLEELRRVKDGLGERKAYYTRQTPTERSVFRVVGWNYIRSENRVK